MKKVSRREFLKFSAMAGAAAVLPLKFALREAWAQYGFNSPNLTKFVDLIRPVTSIPIAVSDGTRTWGSTTATHYSVEIIQFNDLLHSDFVTPTRTIPGWVAPPAPAFISANFTGSTLWGFNTVGNATPKHLGGIIVAGRNQPVQITFQNTLPVNTLTPNA